MVNGAALKAGAPPHWAQPLSPAPQWAFGGGEGGELLCHLRTIVLTTKMISQWSEIFQMFLYPQMELEPGTYTSGLEARSCSSQYWIEGGKGHELGLALPLPSFEGLAGFPVQSHDTLCLHLPRPSLN